MKKYNFDEIITRKGTNCVKHDGMGPSFGKTDLLPMWVADMDFRTPDFIMEAIRTRCQHEVLGYATASESYYESVTHWLLCHYHISAPRKTLHFIPGIVAGIAFVIQAYTQPGDNILVMTPVYPPFLNLPLGGSRQLRCSKLKIINGRFCIDFDQLDQYAAGCKLMILSNPHNPGGTVWSRSDLEKIADICHRHHVIVVSDEIHADLTLPGYQHTSFSTINDTAKENSITFIAPSKTFNMAGLGSSIAYTPNDSLREQLHHYLDSYELANGNIFAFVGAEAAFRYGEEWLDQLKAYLNENVQFLNEYIVQFLPKVKTVLPEASFLPWLDFNAYDICHNDLRDRFINQAKVALNDGTTFGGPDYNGCFRLNIGCPRLILRLALDRIASVIDK